MSHCASHVDQAAIDPATGTDDASGGHSIESRSLPIQRSTCGCQRDPCCGSEGGHSAGRICPPFFAIAIVLMLTGGVGWGVWLLWQIGLGGSFTAAPVTAINAHGHVQIFGWVGLFIMGFGYQAFPRIWNARLAAPRLTPIVLGLMVCGLIVKSAALTLSEGSTALAWLAAAAGGVEVVAVFLFAAQIVVTMERRAVPAAPAFGFILLALGWFFLSTVGSVWHTWNVMQAPSREALVFIVGTYQAPLRDAQLHGVALAMILGVSMIILPNLFGISRTPPRRGLFGLFLLAIAVAGEVVFLIALQWTQHAAAAVGLYLMWVLLAAAVFLIAGPWRLWRPAPLADRSVKFVRIAYAWLGISLVMLLIFPLYQALSGEPFSHAYYGAIRHAFTVGFVSMMIMGVGAKVAANLAGADTRQLCQLWGPFLLVNIGCASRVTLQIGTDWSPGAFSVVGTSGLLELAGLAWWGVLMIRLLFGRAAAHPALGLNPQTAAGLQ